MELDLFSDRTWQMSLGERAAIEGLLAQLRPALAIEIGTAEGAGLRRIAAYAGEVHSFDLEPPTLPVPGNATLHTGDSHELLPQFLAGLVEAGRHVEFVVVDGDHSPEGVRRDIEDLLDCRAVAQAVILIHDTANPRVRAGVDSVSFEAWPKVRHVELDWIPGRLFAEPQLRRELWYGLGLVLVDSSEPAYLRGEVYEQRYVPAGPLLAEARELVLARDLAPAGIDREEDAARLRLRLRRQMVELSAARLRAADVEAREGELLRSLEFAQSMRERDARTLAELTGSPSWKITEPLRAFKRLTGRRQS